MKCEHYYYNCSTEFIYSISESLPQEVMTIIDKFEAKISGGRGSPGGQSICIDRRCGSSHVWWNTCSSGGRGLPVLLLGTLGTGASVIMLSF